ncbi:MAG: hypothetical protein HC867_02450 [Bacteroidia bacterium]|nr:hypothetical protein [Bacteroidia bacterium]
MPYISVRFSSENLSMIFLLAGIYCLIKQQPPYRRVIAAGALLGFSFLFRYQSAIAIMGLALYLTIIERIRFSKFLAFGASILLVISAGIFLDKFFYNDHVITPLNYIRVNVLKAKPQTFRNKPMVALFYPFCCCWHTTIKYHPAFVFFHRAFQA